MYIYIYNVYTPIHVEHNPYYHHMACVSGQAGVFTATDGLQLAYLSGRYSEQDYTASIDNKSLVGFVICIHTYIHMGICIVIIYFQSNPPNSSSQA